MLHQSTRQYLLCSNDKLFIKEDNPISVEEAITAAKSTNSLLQETNVPEKYRDVDIDDLPTSMRLATLGSNKMAKRIELLEMQQRLGVFDPEEYTPGESDDESVESEKGDTFMDFVVDDADDMDVEGGLGEETTDEKPKQSDTHRKKQNGTRTSRIVESESDDSMSSSDSDSDDSSSG